MLRILRPNGYSGGPCPQGSREYVPYWADFDGNVEAVGPQHERFEDTLP